MSSRATFLQSLLAVALIATAAPAEAAGPPAKEAGGFNPLPQEALSRCLIRVVDTESSLGPLSRTVNEVTLGDLVRFHGHPCDGLVAAAGGISLGLEALFPEGIVDRTDLASATNASPCYSDVAAYLTGARTIYGTLVIDKALADEWILLRRSTGKAVRVVLKPGVKPADLPSLEKKLRATGCDGALIALVQSIQLVFIHNLLASPPASLYEVVPLPAYPYAVTGERPDAAKARCGARGH